MCKTVLIIQTGVVSDVHLHLARDNANDSCLSFLENNKNKNHRTNSLPRCDVCKRTINAATLYPRTERQRSVHHRNVQFSNARPLLLHTRTAACTTTLEHITLRVLLLPESSAVSLHANCMPTPSWPGSWPAYLKRLVKSWTVVILESTYRSKIPTIVLCEFSNLNHSFVKLPIAWFTWSGLEWTQRAYINNEY